MTSMKSNPKPTLFIAWVKVLLMRRLAGSRLPVSRVGAVHPPLMKEGHLPIPSPDGARLVSSLFLPLPLFFFLLLSLSLLSSGHQLSYRFSTTQQLLFGSHPSKLVPAALPNSLPCLLGLFSVVGA
ncbi:hypothetical protein ASPZODRAFT_967312 [Penicilliopsis zonata CBS 506.65]|uniref:Uncharacterized protein n=1 Tax=Penicilliopsis zonata CBS 506.65 TaxID=1073090 RepID=A0A1L9SQM1_9EURO|nr:hypothetical protein ASPZODRAFT_967312 [Penicilliopsis zonata CBS 506.65]OJJ49539.1 hypothetical protein ASPZODRAFT_967312 [Penicilliopsis zonata CBS 506.65]